MSAARPINFQVELVPYMRVFESWRQALHDEIWPSLRFVMVSASIRTLV